MILNSDLQALQFFNDVKYRKYNYITIRYQTIGFSCESIKQLPTLHLQNDMKRYHVIAEPPNPEMVIIKTVSSMSYYLLD
jgi:hypothetical protein